MLYLSLSTLYFVHLCSTARILGVFPIASYSHQEMFQPIWKELAMRGHEVTVISPNILKENIANLTEIDIGAWGYDFFRNANMPKILHKDNYAIQTACYVHEMALDFMRGFFKLPQITQFMADKNKTFDLVIIESITISPHAFGYKYNAPVIGISSFGGTLNLYDSVGNPTHPIISPDVNLNILDDSSFSARLSSVTFNVLFRLLYHCYYMPKYDKVVRAHFGDSMPYLGDLERNLSLLLLNVNPLLTNVRANVPAVIELSHMHIKPKKTLPQDLRVFLDSSTEGVIYFNLGSNVRSAELPEATQQIIKSALSELPYKVLWKWESDNMPGKPENVEIRKWLPQQDILGHPNIKAFVTQGGIQSIEEAITNKVPMVAMPFFGDQPLNVQKLLEKGLAKYIDFTTMSKNDLKSAILEVVENPKYKENIRRINSLLLDQPMVGLEKAIWWIEYVLRHKGAKHLRSPAVDLPYWKYFCLDVITVMLLASLVFLYLAWKLVELLINRRTVFKLKVY